MVKQYTLKRAITLARARNRLDRLKHTAKLSERNIFKKQIDVINTKLPAIMESLSIAEFDEFMKYWNVK